MDDSFPVKLIEWFIIWLVGGAIINAFLPIIFAELSISFTAFLLTPIWTIIIIVLAVMDIQDILELP
jgi:hypothetical protein